MDSSDHAIYALTDGVVVITSEKFKPNLNNEIVKRFYSDIEGERMVRYVHVIPKKAPNVFKLVGFVWYKNRILEMESRFKSWKKLKIKQQMHQLMSLKLWLDCN